MTVANPFNFSKFLRQATGHWAVQSLGRWDTGSRGHTVGELGPGPCANSIHFRPRPASVRKEPRKPSHGGAAPHQRRSSRTSSTEHGSAPTRRPLFRHLHASGRQVREAPVAAGSALRGRARSAGRTRNQAWRRLERNSPLGLSD